jgi:hypothetical protein
MTTDSIEAFRWEVAGALANGITLAGAYVAQAERIFSWERSRT